MPLHPLKGMFYGKTVSFIGNCFSMAPFCSTCIACTSARFTCAKDWLCFPFARLSALHTNVLSAQAFDWILFICFNVCNRLNNSSPHPRHVFDSSDPRNPVWRDLGWSAAAHPGANAASGNHHPEVTRSQQHHSLHTNCHSPFGKTTSPTTHAMPESFTSANPKRNQPELLSFCAVNGSIWSFDPGCTQAASPTVSRSTLGKRK